MCLDLGDERQSESIYFLAGDAASVEATLCPSGCSGASGGGSDTGTRRWRQCSCQRPLGRLN